VCNLQDESGPYRGLFREWVCGSGGRCEWVNLENYLVLIPGQILTLFFIPFSGNATVVGII
jgi:hypothetical protein